ncbi:permease [bacterium]|nr:permease [bacterium]MBU4361582.1 permease [bacterium]MBU4602593.1 permease [bacterium]
MKQRSKIFIIVTVFVFFYFMPFSSSKILNALLESLLMVQDYARQHVLLCLIPAFFIAGAIANFISQENIIKYFGAEANKFLSYTAASVSGTILAVCSCTVLPLFAGIYKRGAGIGPATTFLYSGPAINVLAIILTARVLGFELGLARAIGAIIFSIVIGLSMHFIFHEDEKEKIKDKNIFTESNVQEERPLWQTVFYFAILIGILVFANWGKAESIKTWQVIYSFKWYITGILSTILLWMIVKWFNKKERAKWVSSSWGFAEQILPLLLGGVLVAGFLLGRPGSEALIPKIWIENSVGGNSLWSNLFASVIGALMYFATLTEIPILQGLLGAGMGKGPALALLLAGPALSLPNMLVIRSILGTKKALVFIFLVVTMATLSGMIFGYFF